MKNIFIIVNILVVYICLNISLIGCNKKKAPMIDIIPEKPDKVIIMTENFPENNLKEKENKTVTVSGKVYFDFDSYKLNGVATNSLDNLIATLRNNPDVKLILYGGCCPIGKFEYNLRLGYKRANEVYSYISQYVDNKIEIVSLGENGLVTTNENEYYLNRRVEIKSQER